MGKSDELVEIADRYERRCSVHISDKYNIFRPEVYLGVQERERALIHLLKKIGCFSVADKKVLEIGCGSGGNLLELLRLGFLPENLMGNELLEERVKVARNYLPENLKIISGDARTLEFPESTFDIVYQSVVFSSILDDAFQKELADKMWKMTKSGGGILWYDFIYNNPYNSDVRGMPLDKVKNLFPEGEILKHRVTLAPPISRRVTKFSPILYSVFNLFPFLRTHVLCWIKKS